MNKYIFLLAITMIFAEGFGQHKTITLYYPNDSTNVVSIEALDSMVIFICGASKVSYGGKDYNTALIGSQCWLKENLDIGTMINGPENSFDNGVTEKYCYNNDPIYCTTYGALYQWDEAMQYTTTPGAQGLCPTGWHIPTLVEFQTLITAVNNNGNALKAVGQGTGGGAGTNTSGFSALLAGYRSIEGYFYSIGYYADFWSSKEYAAAIANLLALASDDGDIFLQTSSTAPGFSVRCIRD